MGKSSDIDYKMASKFISQEEVLVDAQLEEMVSAYVSAPFDKGKKSIEQEGYKIISLKENAILMMWRGDELSISMHRNWTREGIVWVPKKGIFLTKKSPIMRHPLEATNCHREGKEYYLTEGQVQMALSDSIELLDKSIPTKKFGNNKITKYIFGDVAKKYGKFLKNNGINEMEIWLDNIQDKPFARQMWFKINSYRPELVGICRSLDNKLSVRGVFYIKND